MSQMSMHVDQILAGPAGAPPAPPRRAAAIRVFAVRASLKVRHVPEQMADAVLIPVLFTLLFTYVFGGAIDGSTHDYLQQLLPGTLVMSVLLVTVYTGLSLRNDIDAGILDRFRSLPVWRPAAILGAMLGDLVRYLIAGAIVVAIGFGIGYRPAGGAVGVAAAAGVVLSFAFALSWVWTTLALVVRSTTALSTLSFVVQFPLLFTSNVFADPGTMPAGLRSFVRANPVSGLVTTVRDLMHGNATTAQVSITMLASVAVVAVFGPLTMRLYARRP